MITSSEEYMRRLDDIQNQAGMNELVMLPGSEARFIIDANERTILVPDEFTFLGVLNDHKAETVYFEIDRYFDQADLSTKTCIVQFEAMGEMNGSEYELASGFYPVTKMDVTTADGKIIFGWEIQNDVTAHAANVYFSIRFYETKSVDDTIVFAYNFNTLASMLPVKNTLNTMNASDAVSPTETEALTEKFTSMAKAVKKDVEAAEQAASQATELVATAQASSGLTDKEKKLILALFKTVAEQHDTAAENYNELKTLWNIEEVTS